jgi:hypothetical protein
LWHNGNENHYTSYLYVYMCSDCRTRRTYWKVITLKLNTLNITRLLYGSTFLFRTMQILNEKLFIVFHIVNLSFSYCQNTIYNMFIYPIKCPLMACNISC